MSVQRNIESEWKMQSYLVYKPNKAGSGTALSLQLRLDPEWTEEGSPVRKNTHGLFLELAPQEGTGEGGFAKFAWGPGKAITVKLGMVDVTKMLASIRQVRMLGEDVPVNYRPGPDKEAKPRTMSSVHKFNDKVTAINFTFDSTRSILRVSKSATHAVSVSLDLHEEIGLQMYLESALKQFFRFGIR